MLIGNVYYNVEFAQNSCIELYSGCDENTDFLFRSYEAASAALTALKDQVLLDIPGVGEFDSNPMLSLYCDIDMPDPETRCLIGLPHDSNGPSLPTIPMLLNGSTQYPLEDQVIPLLPVPTVWGGFQVDNDTKFVWSVWSFSFPPDVDEDGDGIDDLDDNCLDLFNSDQRDTDDDGFGNVCDPDLNNDGIVNFLDIVIFAEAFNTVNSGDADFDGDGFVDFLDFARLTQYFFLPPGPSGQVSSAHAVRTEW